VGAGMQTTPHLGKIFEIDCENPLNRTNLWKLPWKTGIFEKTTAFKILATPLAIHFIFMACYFQVFIWNALCQNIFMACFKRCEDSWSEHPLDHGPPRLWVWASHFTSIGKQKIPPRGKCVTCCELPSSK
jgi:hypothetical protein